MSSARKREDTGASRKKVTARKAAAKPESPNKERATSMGRASPAKPAGRGGKSATKKQPAKKQQAAAKQPARKPPKSAPYETGKWAAAFAPRAPGERRYWLVKSEPDVFSFDDLVHAKDRTTYWDGVRNFAARNFLRDGMKLGDQVFFYHSMADPQAIVGVCEVVREGYPDFTAFDATHPGYDADSDPDAPTWFMVDVRAIAPLARPVTLPEIKARPELANMALLRVGRLSVVPVTPEEWEVIQAMGQQR
jgi:predicted RNA-binding protein with PUA-like domain